MRGERWVQSCFLGSDVEFTPRPKFLRISATELAQMMVTDSPGFFLNQTKEPLPRSESLSLLQGTLVHDVFSTEAFMLDYPASSLKKLPRHIEKIVLRGLPSRFPSLRGDRLRSFQKFLLERGQEFWSIIGEGDDEIKDKIDKLYERISYELLFNPSYFFFDAQRPLDEGMSKLLGTYPYEERKSAWEGMKPIGKAGVKRLWEIFYKEHLAKEPGLESKRFSEVSMIQLLRGREGKLNIQIPSRIDLVNARFSQDLKSGRKVFEGFEIYDFKWMGRIFTQEYKIYKTTLWLNQALNRITYNQFARRLKRDGVVIIEHANIPVVSINVYLVWALESHYPEMVVERLGFTEDENKENEKLFYKWTGWLRKHFDKGDVLEVREIAGT